MVWLVCVGNIILRYFYFKKERLYTMKFGPHSREIFAMTHICAAFRLEVSICGGAIPYIKSMHYGRAPLREAFGAMGRAQKIGSFASWPKL